MNLCIDDKWIIFKDKILGKGTYGCIYLTQNKEDCKFYATKMGLWSNKSTIINEINIIKHNLSRSSQEFFEPFYSKNILFSKLFLRKIACYL